MKLTDKPAADKPEKPKASKNQKPVAVKFLKSHSLYNKDEVAGFPKEKADWLIEKKLATIAPKV